MRRALLVGAMAIACTACGKTKGGSDAAVPVQDSAVPIPDGSVARTPTKSVTPTSGAVAASAASTRAAVVAPSSPSGRASSAHYVITLGAPRAP